MTLVELKACIKSSPNYRDLYQRLKEAGIKSSPNYRDLYQRLKEAGISGKAQIAWEADKINKTLIEDLEKSGYTLLHKPDDNCYIISGW